MLPASPVNWFVTQMFLPENERETQDCLIVLTKDTVDEDECKKPENPKLLSILDMIEIKYNPGLITASVNIRHDAPAAIVPVPNPFNLALTALGAAENIPRGAQTWQAKQAIPPAVIRIRSYSNPLVGLV